MITLKFRKSESTIKPEDVDMTSSPTTVYIRKNIEEVKNKDETSDVETTVFVYDEAKLSKEEYAIYMEEQNAANIDYIAMMNDIEL